MDEGRRCDIIRLKSVKLQKFKMTLQFIILRYVVRKVLGINKLISHLLMVQYILKVIIIPRFNNRV